MSPLRVPVTRRVTRQDAAAQGCPPARAVHRRQATSSWAITVTRTLGNLHPYLLVQGWYSGRAVFTGAGAGAGDAVSYPV